MTTSNDNIIIIIIVKPNHNIINKYYSRWSREYRSMPPREISAP